jgi:hypothetical protein
MDFVNLNHCYYDELPIIYGCLGTKNKRIISTNFLWSSHRLVILSHFSGVVIMMSPFFTFRNCACWVSPVNSVQVSPTVANFLSQSVKPQQKSVLVS